MNPVNVPLQPAQARNVFGLQIMDERLAALTKKVIMLSIASALLVVANQVVALVTGQTVNAATSVLAVACALAVPFCGYFGAKNGDKNLTCCFCGCNCAGVFLIIVSWVLMYIGYEALEHLVDDCPPSSTNPSCDNIDWTTICPSDSKAACWRKLHDNMPHLRTALIITSIFALPGCLLQFASFWFGKQLHDELSAGRPVVQPPMMPQVAPVAVQPVHFQGQGMQAVRAVPVQGMQGVQPYQGMPVQAVPVQGMQGVQPVQPATAQAFQSVS